MRPATVRAALALALGAIVGLGAGLLYATQGVIVSLPVWALAGMLVAAAWLLLRLLLDLPASPRLAEPDVDGAARGGTTDRELRQLEAQVRGALEGSETTVSTLHATIAHLAHLQRPDGDYPPALAAYLHSAPRALTRAHLRTILRELI